MTGIIILVVAGVVVIWGVSTYNKLVSLRMNVREGFSTIDVFLKKRYDLIPNLVETVKGYAAHEKETLQNVIQARGNAISSSPEDKLKYEGELSNALSRLLMISENYPDLKADSQFINLQKELQNIESEIEKSRRYYNGTVKNLNKTVQSVPSCIIASLFKFEEESFFELENHEERENVQVKF
ncbi:LemA family protein [Terrisporobacter mayombei]|uniref:Protein LemA n=1 Tax=Terrisporobacter mayombei TaxID=1541 RepID=A0ABY9PZK7_9FIRM|nr:LemA family protein [Terrisporobacter mayombei]MCC3866852.1 LemA family protein [Terrisporobacter mayombei]WMT81092.1 Protein LemA [Terrisporobacter mayombei]